MTAVRLTARLLQAVGSFRYVAVRGTARGTHEGRFLDIERTGKTVVMPGMTCSRSGHVRRSVGELGLRSLAQQLRGPSAE